MKGMAIGVLLFFGMLALIALVAGQPFMLSVGILGIAVSFSFMGADV